MGWVGMGWYDDDDARISLPLNYPSFSHLSAASTYGVSVLLTHLPYQPGILI